jgi:hypothetical protein
MAKKVKKKKAVKKKVKKKEDPLKINTSFADVLKIAVTPKK